MKKKKSLPIVTINFMAIGYRNNKFIAMLFCCSKIFLFLLKKFIATKFIAAIIFLIVINMIGVNRKTYCNKYVCCNRLLQQSFLINWLWKHIATNYFVAIGYRKWHPKLFTHCAIWTLPQKLASFCFIAVIAFICSIS